MSDRGKVFILAILWCVNVWGYTIKYIITWFSQ